MNALVPYVEASLPVGDLPNFSQVEPWLYRGGRPRQDGLKQLLFMGIKTIVNLERGWFESEPDEVKKECEFAVENGIRFEHIPLHPFFGPKSKDIDKILSVIVNPANHPVFVHCRRGSDRTGIVIAAFRIQYHAWTVDQAYEEMKRYGHRNILFFWWKNILTQLVPVTQDSALLLKGMSHGPLLLCNTSVQQKAITG